MLWQALSWIELLIIFREQRTYVLFGSSINPSSQQIKQLVRISSKFLCRLNRISRCEAKNSSLKTLKAQMALLITCFSLFAESCQRPTGSPRNPLMMSLLDGLMMLLTGWWTDGRACSGHRHHCSNSHPCWRKLPLEQYILCQPPPWSSPPCRPWCPQCVDHQTTWAKCRQLGYPRKGLSVSIKVLQSIGLWVK